VFIGPAHVLHGYADFMGYGALRAAEGRKNKALAAGSKAKSYAFSASQSHLANYAGAKGRARPKGSRDLWSMTIVSVGISVVRQLITVGQRGLDETTSA
jgi:hypothetical protein